MHTVNRFKHRLWHRIRHIGLAVSLILTTVSFGFSPIAHATADCTAGTTLNVVAHPDDDLLFQNPDILHDIQAGKCVKTLVLTAGDAGSDASYVTDRQDGLKAAYASLAGATDSWSAASPTINSHTAQQYTLQSNENISLLFLNLPDGSPTGAGTPATNYESLEKLWNNDLGTIHTFDGLQSYTRQGLIDTVAAVMNTFQPQIIRTLDYVGQFGPDYSTAAADGDHSDHHAAGRFAFAAHRAYNSAPNNHQIIAYYGSGLAGGANISGADLSAKQAAFYAYGEKDGTTECSAASCGETYATLLQRQYIADKDTWSVVPWSFNTVDGNSATGGKQMANTGQRPTSIQFGSSLYTFYYNQSAQSLRYMATDGTTTSYGTLDATSSNMGDFSTAVVYNNQLHVFYHDAANGYLKQAWSSNGTSWSIERLDAIANNVGGTPVAMVYGTTLQVFYYDFTAGDLRHAWYNGTTWQTEILDGSTSGVSHYNANVGTNPTTTINGDGSLQLFYYDQTSGNLRHAWSNASGWHFEVLDGDSGSVAGYNADVGSSSAATFYGNTLQVVYYDATGTNLRHAWADASGWHFENLDGDANSVSGYNANSGYNPSMTVSGNELHVFIYDATHGYLRHLWSSPSVGWQSENLDGSGGSPTTRLQVNVGAYSTANVLNGKLHVLYYDSTDGYLREAVAN